MPGLLASASSQMHAKRRSEQELPHSQPKKARTEDTATLQDIKALENAIQGSQKNLNDIVTLLKIADSEPGGEATVSLCRVFSRLISQGRLTRSPDSSQSESVITDWLRQRYSEYKELLSSVVRDATARHPVVEVALTLFSQLLKQELDHAKSSLDTTWRTGVFRSMIRAVLESQSNSGVVGSFIEKFYVPFVDIRFFTFVAVSEDAASSRERDSQAQFSQNCLEVLISTPSLPNTSKLSGYLHKPPNMKEMKQKPPFTKPASHQKQAQRAWLTLLGSALTVSQRKQILQILTKTVVPCIAEPIRLMDFLTDSFNEGGSMALLALSGMFEMMTTCNLDYPQFYNKLYSLLDDDILHSSHRSRFFRLLNQFLDSTHVPVAMIASFIKKLARLAVHAPPAAIVAVIPLAYNLLSAHRSCTFMIHREVRTEEERQLVELEGAEDPFDPKELDPMETGAIDSSLWELVALQNHYHPNVSSLASIISQQFTKPSYNLEDFLDHSYSALVAAELGKEVKKEPVVEFEIPKKIFVVDKEDTSLEGIMLEVMQAQ